MDFFLGLDGGGTGCRAVVTDRAGQVIGRAEGGPANIVTDPAGARANILAAVEAALGGAGPLADVTAVLGLAGGNIGGPAGQLSAALPFRSTRVVSDAVTALRGALGEDDGVMAALGTGSVFARQAGGRVTVIGGWGFVLGDEGGGAWIGRALLARALLAQDGRAGMTPLLSALLAEAGGAAQLVLDTRNAPPATYAAFARRAVETPDDPAAAAVLAGADGEILDAIGHLNGAGLPVTFTGGLGPVFAARLKDRLGAPIRASRGSALDGALAMARAEGGA